MNHGRRHARVHLVAFKIATVRGELLPPLHQGSDLPIKLEDGEDAAFMYPIESFFNAFLEAVPFEKVFPFPELRFWNSKVIVAVATAKPVSARFTSDLCREFAKRYRAAREKARDADRPA